MCEVGAQKVEAVIASALRELLEHGLLEDEAHIVSRTIDRFSGILKIADGYDSYSKECCHQSHDTICLGAFSLSLIAQSI